MAEAATSRGQILEVRSQKFKVSPAATVSNIEDNVCEMDTSGGNGRRNSGPRFLKRHTQASRFSHPYPFSEGRQHTPLSPTSHLSHTSVLNLETACMTSSRLGRSINRFISAKLPEYTQSSPSASIFL